MNDKEEEGNEEERKRERNYYYYCECTEGERVYYDIINAQRRERERERAIGITRLRHK